MKYTFNVALYNYETIAKMEEWCKNNLYHGGYYEPNWHYQKNEFVFTDEREFMWFTLRWAGYDKTSS